MAPLLLAPKLTYGHKGKEPILSLRAIYMLWQSLINLCVERQSEAAATLTTALQMDQYNGLLSNYS